MANFLIDHEYTLDITPSARPQLVPVSEYDVGRIFTFTLKHNGEEMTIPSSYGAVTVEGTIGSYAFSESASIENGKIVFQLTESMTAHAGKAWTKIKFANADAPISTCAFFLVVDRAGVEAETVIGASGFEQQIVNAVYEYLEDVAIDDSVVAGAVDDWLDNHPEATTTVQDGSLTEAKFSDALKLKTINNYVTPELYGAVENGVCDVAKFQAMLAEHSYIKFDSDFEFRFVQGSTIDAPTRIKIENKKGIVIDGCGHTVTMSGLTKTYLNSINDRSSSGRDIFSFLAFHSCEDITVRNINFIGTNAADADNNFRFASPRSICIAFKGCKNALAENVNGSDILGNVVNASTADDLSTGCDGIIIENCKAKNCYENGFNIMGASTNSIIDNCISIRCGTGMEAFGDTCIIQNCLIEEARSSGVSVSGGATVKNCKVIGSTGEGAGKGIGISVTGANTLISKNCKVLNNHVVDCKGYGIYVYPYTENTDVVGNIFENNNTLNTYSMANNITGTSTVKTKDLTMKDNIFVSTIDDQKCLMVDNVNGVSFVNNIVEHSLPTVVYTLNFSASCENIRVCGNTLTKRVNVSTSATNYFVGMNVVGNTIPDIVTG